MPRNEVEAAYFSLLRAREELDALRRYDEFLRAEGQRLRRGINEREALAESIDRRLLRALRHTEQPLSDAIEDRLTAIGDERERLPDRLVAAEAYVEECEREYAQLAKGR